MVSAMRLFADCYFKRLYVLIPICILISFSMAIVDPVFAPLFSSLSWASLIYMITISAVLLPGMSTYKSAHFRQRFVSFNALSIIVTVFTIAVCSPIMAFLAADHNVTIDPLQYTALIGASVFWLPTYLCTAFVLAVRGHEVMSACGLLLGLSTVFIPLVYILGLDIDVGPDFQMPDTGFLLAVMAVSIALLAVSEIIAYRHVELYDSDRCESRFCDL